MAVTAPKDVKSLADLLTMPVDITTRDGSVMQNVSVIDWNNNYGLVCQMVFKADPYWCYVPMSNIAQICRKTNI